VLTRTSSYSKTKKRLNDANLCERNRPVLSLFRDFCRWGATFAWLCRFSPNCRQHAYVLVMPLTTATVYASSSLSEARPLSLRTIRREGGPSLRCKLRNLIEQMFRRLKDWRRIVTRYDKLATNFAAAVAIAAAITWWT
jgi:transposase